MIYAQHVGCKHDDLDLYHLYYGKVITKDRLEKMKFRNQLRATRDRVESYRMKLVDSPLDSPASQLTIIRKRGLVTRRWSFSASIRARRVLAIFTHATVKSTFLKGDAARELTPRTAIGELRGRAGSSQGRHYPVQRI